MIASVLVPLFLATTITCSSAKSPCASFSNTSTGPALGASSAAGPGALGYTAAEYYLSPGVEAESTNVTGSDAAAVFGLNFLTSGVAPTYGVLTYGSLNGLYGQTTGGGTTENAAGVFGQDAAVSNYPDYNAGVLGASAAGTGVLAEAAVGPAENGPYGTGPIGIYAVAQRPTSKAPPYGLVAESDDVSLAATNPDGTNYVYLLHGRYLISAYSFQGASPAHFTVDSAGSGDFSGTVTTSKGIYARTTGASGTTRVAYGARDAAPEIEDEGEGELRNGYASVTLDPAMADSIDLRRPYRVFVTPDGDANQLYVAQKGPQGFVVRESGGGHSTLAFDYRIVGTPYGDDGARLPPAPRVVAPRRHRSGRARVNVGAAASPEARLRQILGAQGYAEVLLEKQKELTNPY